MDSYNLYNLETAEEEVADARTYVSSEMDFEDNETSTLEHVWVDTQDMIDPATVGWEDDVLERVSYYQNRDNVFKCQSQEALNALSVTFTEEELEPAGEYAGLWWALEKRQMQIVSAAAEELDRVTAIASERNERIASGVITPKTLAYAIDFTLTKDVDIEVTPAPLVEKKPRVSFPLLMKMGTTMKRIENYPTYMESLNKGYHIYVP